MPVEFDSNLFSLGVIRPTPGTPLGIFTNYPELLLSDPTRTGAVAMILFQADTENSGEAYIGTQRLDLTDPLKPGLLYTLVNPGDSFSVSSYGLNIFEALKFRVDVEKAGDGVQVSIHIR